MSLDKKILLKDFNNPVVLSMNKENPDLYGRYIFGDYCTGRIWSFKLENGKPVGFINLRNKIKKHSSDIPLFISSFGEDSSGELYIVDYLGAVYKFVSNK